MISSDPGELVGQAREGSRTALARLLTFVDVVHDIERDDFRVYRGLTLIVRVLNLRSNLDVREAIVLIDSLQRTDICRGQRLIVNPGPIERVVRTDAQTLLQRGKIEVFGSGDTDLFHAML